MIPGAVGGVAGGTGWELTRSQEVKGHITTGRGFHLKKDGQGVAGRSHHVPVDKHIHMAL